MKFVGLSFMTACLIIGGAIALSNISVTHIRSLLPSLGESVPTVYEVTLLTPQTPRKSEGVVREIDMAAVANIADRQERELDATLQELDWIVRATMQSLHSTPN